MKLLELVDGNFFKKHKPLTPSSISKPTFLLNYPLSLTAKDPNNELMKELTPAKRKIDHKKAEDQFMKLNNFITGANGVVYLLPSYSNFQDQVYVSNLGTYLPHIKDRDVIILSKFRTPPRRGEEVVGEKFFSMAGYETHKAPFFQEGQAELKFIKDRLYVGGYGQRSDKRAYSWMTEKFDMTVILVETKDPKMYHLDCQLLRLTPEKILCPKKALSEQEIKNLEKHVDIINIPIELAITGSFNGVSIGQHMMYKDPDKYVEPGKKEQNKALIKRIHTFHENLEKETGIEPVFFDLTEFEKSGADLGCLIMHLNFVGWE